jgi:serine/threonine-protein kinase
MIGSRVGNYEVRAKLGAGEMGSIYLAEHPLIGKRVALKVLHPDLAGDGDAVERFFAEARVVNAIRHPGIVDILDFGMIPSLPPMPATVCCVMELLEGQSLAELLAAGAPLPAARAVAVATQIAEALGAAHSVGIVHRDLKPENIYLCVRDWQRDHVKLLDFGLAALVGARRTRPGVLMGSAPYFAPEQAEGRVDHRVDIYGLGVLFFQMLTGRLPFRGGNFNRVVLRHLSEAPPRPSLFAAVPRHLELVCIKAMAKDPDQRFQSMAELCWALFERAPAPRRRWPRLPPLAKWVVPAALVFGFAVAAFANALTRSLDSPPAPVARPSASDPGSTPRWAGAFCEILSFPSGIGPCYPFPHHEEVPLLRRGDSG